MLVCVFENLYSIFVSSLYEKLWLRNFFIFIFSKIFFFDTLNAHYGHKIVSWICQFWTRKCRSISWILNYSWEIFYWLLGIIKVNNITLSKKYELIEYIEYIWILLMNSLNDGSSRISQVFQSLHHLSCSIWIKTSRWLIQEDQTGVSD